MGNMFSNLPYFWSAQLDDTKDQIDNRKDTSRLEGWIGFLVFNLAVWVTVVALDIHLLATEFKNIESEVHILQTAALTSTAVSAGTMLLFTLIHYCNDTPFSSGELGKEARVLPPFATALIVGGLRATNWFTMLLLILAGLTHEKDSFKILVAQACLKTFGTAMAMANQRYKSSASIAGLK